MIWLLWSLTANADDPYRTDLARMTPADRHVLHCKTEADGLAVEGDIEKIIAAWQACDAKAERDSDLAPSRPALQGYIRLAELERDFGSWKVDRKSDYAELILATAAQRADLLLPFEAVRTAWIHIANDPDERQNLKEVRSVTIRWTAGPEINKTELAELDEQVRRFVADMGFHVPAPDSFDAGEAAIMVFVTPTITHRVWEKTADLKITDVELHTKPIKYRTAQRSGQPIDVVQSGNYRSREVAKQEAFEAAAQDFARQLLLDVVSFVYRDHRIPPSPEQGP